MSVLAFDKQRALRISSLLSMPDIVRCICICTRVSFGKKFVCGLKKRGGGNVIGRVAVVSATPWNMQIAKMGKFH